MLSSEPAPPHYQEISANDVASAEGDIYPALVITVGDSRHVMARISGSWAHEMGRLSRVNPTVTTPFIRATGVDDEVAGRWWDVAALSDAEEHVITCLNRMALELL